MEREDSGLEVHLKYAKLNLENISKTELVNIRIQNSEKIISKRCYFYSRFNLNNYSSSCCDQYSPARF